jgi:hypothetical protein
MSDEINPDRRRFLGMVAMTMAADLVANSADAQS